ncbi:MAG: M28 family peptidase [Saprospiraceae bacterium]|nr:M28 family peptidase [Saprospiraceae bacterium]
MKKYIIFSLSLVWAVGLFAQADKGNSAENTVLQNVVESNINPAILSEFLTVLASDVMEGRETGQMGQQKAAEYIGGKFQDWGIPPVAGVGYFQPISFFTEKWYNLGLQANGKSYDNMRDYYGIPATNRKLVDFSFKKMYFLGYGIDDPAYSDYNGNKVKGKVIIIYSGEPKGKDGNYLISGNSTASDWSNDFRKKLLVAKEKGAAAVIIIDPDIKKNISANRNEILGGSNQMGSLENKDGIYPNNIFISSTVARDMIGGKIEKVIAQRERIENGEALKKVKITGDFEINFDKNETLLEGSNVLGYIEGSDPVMKNEVVIVTAHYDHLGKRGESIFNGADDNGSGSSTVMSVAKALQAAKDKGMGPKRSILCMLVSGEEKGLLGSKYYVNYPIFPLENTVADVNVDMVGRVDKKYANNPNYIYVIGSDRLSSELHTINEEQNKQHTQLVLDYKYNDEKDPNRYYYRSDHYNFAKNNIPAIFYFNGTHDDYHKPSDTVDKINFEKMAKIGELVFYVTWELANRDKRIEVDVKN